MQVAPWLYLNSAAVQHSRALWKALAGVETAVLRHEIDSVPIEAPIYIAGVARAGTTILLEMLSRHQDVTSHRYSDFPYIYTPYWRNWLRQHQCRPMPTPRERAHGDRILITEESPEALEEIFWMEYFPGRHRPFESQVLCRDIANPAFAAFYRDHIRKLLLVRNRRRYLSKGNYNLTRLAYIQTLFPDARFIIPVRHPREHIASLLKQDRIFQRGLSGNERARRYLAWVGHFEFGRDKRPIHLGDDALAAEIVRCWEDGDPVRGWALHWNSLYAFALDCLEADPDLRRACLWLRYEDLCETSDEAIEQILHHCALPAEAFAPVKRDYIGFLAKPDYYRADFDESDERTIAAVCGETAYRLGYEPSPQPEGSAPALLG